MILRIVCKSKDLKKGYAEEVFNVHEIKPAYLSLVKNPVQYMDRHGREWSCEKEDILTDFSGMEIVPAICKGVYRVTFSA